MESFSNIAQLSDKYDVFIFDCDGVLWNGPEQIPGSLDVVKSLMAQGKQVFMMTNASFSSGQYLNESKLIPFGLLDFPVNHIYSSGVVTARTLKQMQPSPDKNSVFVVGNPGLKTLIREQTGLNVVEDSTEDHDFGFTDFDAIAQGDLDPSVFAVVVGIDWTATYRTLCLASLYMQKNQAAFIGCNTDRNMAMGTRFVAGNGCILNFLETATGIKPTIMGKPSTRAFELIREDHGLTQVPLSKCLMVGDNLQTDICFAQANGIDSLLVLSGCTSQQKMTNPNTLKEALPTYIQPQLQYNGDAKL